MQYEKVILASDEHVYTAELKNGMAIIAEVTQAQIDLVIDVYGPANTHLKQINKRKKGSSTELIDFTANKSGKYKFIVRLRGSDINKGSYVLKIKQLLSLEDNARRIAKKELPTQTLYDLWELSLKDKNAIDNFIDNHDKKHLIEAIAGNDADMLITYFCVPDVDTEYVMQSGGRDFLGLRFRRLGKTRLFFATQVVANDARFNYGFNYFKLHKAGPDAEIESREVVHSYDGIVEMPNAPKQPYIIEKHSVPKGKVWATTINSSSLKEERKITVYVPTGYDEKKSHNLLIVFDGESYGARVGKKSRIPTATILDNLLAENKIKPTIAVLVWNMGKRSRDLVSHSFADFIAKELIPWARSNYNILPNASNVIVAGSSRGGYAASNIALLHSDVVGNVLSQSGSYWIKATADENHWIYPNDSGKLIGEFKNNKRLPIKFYMEIGRYDAGASMLGSNRQLRDILQVKGYDVDYREFNGGHSYVNWR